MITHFQFVNQLKKGSGTNFGDQKCKFMETYQIIGLVFIFVGLWIAFEMYRAPTMDDNGKITKPGKKFSDLWRKRR